MQYYTIDNIQIFQKHFFLLYILTEKISLTLDMHRVINCLHCMQNWSEEKKSQQLFLNVTIALVCVVFIVSYILLVSIFFTVYIARWMTQCSKSKANGAHLIISARWRRQCTLQTECSYMQTFSIKRGMSEDE